MALGSLGDQKGHVANILKKTLQDGKIRVYEDATGGAQRHDIILPHGVVSLVKDYEVAPTRAEFKRIDVYSNDNELLHTISITPGDQLHNYQFFSGSNQVGRGSGDIVTALVQRLGTEQVDPRYTTGAKIDDEVIGTINSVLRRKTDTAL